MTQDDRLPDPGSSADNVQMLETRIAQLEDQIQGIKMLLARQQGSPAAGGSQLPDTQLLSPSFLSRAFAVWGHMLVAQLIIVVPLYCLIFLFSALGN